MEIKELILKSVDFFRTEPIIAIVVVVVLALNFCDFVLFCHFNRRDDIRREVTGRDFDRNESTVTLGCQ